VGLVVAQPARGQADRRVRVDAVIAPEVECQEGRHRGHRIARREHQERERRSVRLIAERHANLLANGPAAEGGVVAFQNREPQLPGRRRVAVHLVPEQAEQLRTPPLLPGFRRSGCARRGAQQLWQRVGRDLRLIHVHRERDARHRQRQTHALPAGASQAAADQPGRAQPGGDRHDEAGDEGQRDPPARYP
jgi:hypothetical protein